MGIFLEVIEATDQQPGELARRIPAQGSAETKFGSQLVVRDYQAAIFRKDGKALDAFGPGRHTLETKNLPILTKILSLPWGFKSPFRCEVVFVSLRTLPDLRWGTREPVPFRDAELGLVRLRAFGTYGIRVAEPIVFVNALVGADGMYTSAQLEEYLRSSIVSRLNDWLGENLKSIFDLASQYDELSKGLSERLADDFKRFGLVLDNFRVNAITPPDEVQKAIDERSRMKAIGNMGEYTRMKAADALGAAAANPGGLGAAGVGVGAGFGLGGIMADAMRGGGALGGGGGGGGGAGGNGGGGGEGAAAGRSVADLLRDLTALHKEGILTAEEYAAKKADLLKKL
jgi:membrane protease subunit (stomatin/prohibitin family)